MKTTRKLLSLVLALVMLVSLSVTAFAADAGTATINVVANGKTTTITVDAGQKLNAALNKNVRKLGKLTWDTVNDWQEAGVTHQVLKGIGTNVSKTGTTADLAGSQFASVQEAAAVSGHPGYYLVDQDGDSYHYVYVGYDWTYTSTTVNGGDLYTYMCCYTLTAGETVTITYSLQITDWTQTGAIQ